ncbi:hypothetical protein ACLK18_01505 [Escherichia coli]
MNRESVWNIEPVTHDENPNDPTGCDEVENLSGSDLRHAAGDANPLTTGIEGEIAEPMILKVKY